MNAKPEIVVLCYISITNGTVFAVFGDLESHEEHTKSSLRFVYSPNKQFVLTQSNNAAQNLVEVGLSWRPHKLKCIPIKFLTLRWSNPSMEFSANKWSLLRLCLFWRTGSRLQTGQQLGQSFWIGPTPFPTLSSSVPFLKQMYRASNPDPDPSKQIQP